MNRRLQDGFTLVELLVAIGIIGALAALLVPMVIRSSRQASKIRAQSDLQVISTALTAYKGDFGDIPRPDYTAGTGAVGSQTASLASSSGAALLCKALLGPGNAQYASTDLQFVTGKEYKPGDFVVAGTASYTCIKDTSTNPTSDSLHQFWTPFWIYDGADGPGFRARAGAKVWGPYLPPEKIGNRGMALTDHNGGVVLYFPSNPTSVNVNSSVAISTASGSYMAYADYPGSTNPPLRGVPSRFNLGDNFEYFRRVGSVTEADNVVRNRMRIELGDYDANGYINDNDSPASVPFVLISPGSDGIYGPANVPIPASVTAADVKALRDAFNKCDDATNLDVGQ